MKTRLDFRKILEQLLVDNNYPRNIYYDPPSGFRMKFPCFTYQLSGVSSDHADNLPYNLTQSYLVTWIDKDPDSPMVDKILQIPTCRMNRSFAVDGLNHTTFIIQNI